ncbi:unnamed protein product [Fusarium fujikuroi]|nr:hypothetical protein CEK25_004643 [Fusarium fujikuroi]VZH96461.1 unnamed protein product [Fusarium fujikuroi]
MADHDDHPPMRRRAPTITINTTAVNPNISTEPPQESNPSNMQDDAVSPTTVSDPVSTSGMSQRPSRPELDTSLAFENRDSRPTSPHNVSSPVTSRSGERGVGFLSVPMNHRSRQNSVDSDDMSRSVSSQGDTTVVASNSTQTDTLKGSEYNHKKIINDESALKPDAGTEQDFKVENNPFAFTPGQMNKMFNPKSLPAFYMLGGIDGIEKGLRSDRKAGLSMDEKTLTGKISFEDATSKKQMPREDHAAAQTGAGFADRLRVFKDNRLPEKKGKSLLELMWITYNDKVLILLSIAAVVSLAVGLYQTFGQKHEPGEPKVEWVEGVAIIVAIAIVVIVGSLNDYQKERQFTKLNKKKQDRLVKVIRFENHDDLKKMDPFIQSGARIMEGVGTYMATSVGVYSSYGKTLMSLNEDPEMTPLQAKLNVIATYIAKLGSAAGLVLFIALFIKFLAGLPASDDTPAEKGQQFLNIFIVVVTIIVVAVPEGLPLAVTLALAFATTRMLRDANLVRHLKACEVMGNASTICSDKTGTLTQNKMQVVSGTIGTSLRFGGSSSGDASGASTPVDTSGDIGISEFARMLSKPVKDLLLKSIALNSTAFEGEVDGEKTFIGSKTETALLILAKSHLGMGPVSEERENAKVLQLIPFDSGRKCMGIVTQGPNGSARLYIKGASEIILSKCTQVLGDPANDDSLAPMSDDNVRTVQQLIESYAKRSLRTIGICYKDFSSWPPKNAGRVDGGNEVVFDDLFSDMAFIGVVGIQDPLREGVPEAVKLCQQAGVVVRMVTGDNKITAEAIAKECGIIQPNSIVMEGPEFRNLSKLEQEEIIPRLHVLARSSPEDKRILVKRLKDKNETVAVTGDGTNDAPALKMADVGFSMGISGTEVAKEASAIILMDDNFTSIVKALKWGRAVNDAVKRFLQFQLTVNITAVILTFVTAVSNNEESSVLTAVQLLWVNLIMDTLAALALATDPPHDSVLDRKPEPKGSSIISVTMWKMILGQSIYQLVITFVLYYYGPIVPLSPKPEKDEIKTLVFNTFVWMQIFNQWNNRRLDNKFNIFEGLTKNWFFIGISAIMCGGQILIIFVGGEAFQIAKKKQSGELWAMAIVLGFLSIPVGVIIRLIPDHFLEALIPEFLKQRAKKVPGLTVSDEEMSMYPEPLADVRDELNFIRRMKGGRLNNLKFAIQHPKEAVEMVRSRSPSHSRSNSLNAPQTPIQENPFDGSPIGTPNSGRGPRSTRSRSNSALGAPTVMAGIVAAGVAAGWQPKMRPDNDGDNSDSPR